MCILLLMAKPFLTLAQVWMRLVDLLRCGVLLTGTFSSGSLLSQISQVGAGW